MSYFNEKNYGKRTQGVRLMCLLEGGEDAMGNVAKDILRSKRAIEVAPFPLHAYAHTLFIYRAVFESF